MLEFCNCIWRKEHFLNGLGDYLRGLLDIFLTDNDKLNQHVTQFHPNLKPTLERYS